MVKKEMKAVSFCRFGGKFVHHKIHKSSGFQWARDFSSEKADSGFIGSNGNYGTTCIN